MIFKTESCGFTESIPRLKELVTIKTFPVSCLVSGWIFISSSWFIPDILTFSCCLIDWEDSSDSLLISEIFANVSFLSFLFSFLFISGLSKLVDASLFWKISWLPDWDIRDTVLFSSFPLIGFSFRLSVYLLQIIPFFKLILTIY